MLIVQITLLHCASYKSSQEVMPLVFSNTLTPIFLGFSFLNRYRSYEPHYPNQIKMKHHPLLPHIHLVEIIQTVFSRLTVCVSRGISLVQQDQRLTALLQQIESETNHCF